MQGDLTVVLENVHDKHNIGAICRSCDAVGVRDIYILDTDVRMQTEERVVGLAASTGVAKWLNFHRFTDVESCFKALRANYTTILSTHLGNASKSLYELDMSSSLALIFGNEHIGITDEVLALSDGNFIIPQFGMVQSLNISVACAVTLFEACRQRIPLKSYEKAFDPENSDQKEMYESYIQKHRVR